MARTKEFSEDEVLNKAVELFWYKGYNGTSAQDLVNHLGLSRSSLYDTFGDKHTLFIKALQRYRKENAEGVRQVFATHPNVKEAIKFILHEAVKESMQTTVTKGCFMVNTTGELALHDKEVSDIVNSNRQDIEQVFAEAIKRGQEQGQIKKESDPLSLARFIFNNYSGMRVSARSGGIDKKTLDDVVKVTLSVL
jgi:TetR/AcrR family transcriptional repressor of nem operon